MKTKLTILAALIVFAACSSKSNDPTPAKPKVETDATIKPLYDAFVSTAKDYNVTIDKTVVVKYGDCDCQADGVWYTKVAPADQLQEFYVYHTLGHALLGRAENTGVSIMNQSMGSQYISTRESLIKEMFTK